jgi:hypothetical protein
MGICVENSLDEGDAKSFSSDDQEARKSSDSSKALYTTLSRPTTEPIRRYGHLQRWLTYLDGNQTITLSPRGSTRSRARINTD